MYYCILIISTATRECRCETLAICRYSVLNGTADKAIPKHYFCSTHKHACACTHTHTHTHIYTHTRACACTHTLTHADITWSAYEQRKWSVRLRVSTPSCLSIQEKANILSATCPHHPSWIFLLYCCVLWKTYSVGLDGTGNSNANLRQLHS